MENLNIDDAQFQWQNHAACRDFPSYIFYPDERSTPGIVLDPAFVDTSYKEICARCPVKHICLEFALLHDMQGVWGGMTEGERNKRFCTQERYEMRNYKEECGTYEPLYGHS
jgi:hypothetical protein